MPYTHRLLEQVLKKYLQNFCIAGITGPRQSGKSTMLREVYGKDYQYVTFDDPLMIDFFSRDPQGFMSRFDDKVIFDEVQKVPELFSYLKIAVDNDRKNYGKYIITGSSQFTLVKQITESLAGRIGLLSLLPFQLLEIPPSAREKQIVLGSYPELVSRQYSFSKEWYGAYLNTYIEKDVRSLFNIGNLRDFQKLINLLAAHCSQELNMSQLAAQIGVSVKTIGSWISVLEASYIIFLLPPYYKNLGKRIVKRPKVYFYDTGLICYLTGINNQEILDQGPLAGPIFENYVISEIKKDITHRAQNNEIYYYRTNAGLEIDCILFDKDNHLLEMIEIKNNQTARYKMIENIKKIIQLEEKHEDALPTRVRGVLVYKGKQEGKFQDDIRHSHYLKYLTKNNGDS